MIAPSPSAAQLDKLSGSRWLRGAVALVAIGAVGLSPLAARAQAVAEAPAETGLKTVAVVALSDYDGLMEDIDFLGELAGRPAAAQMLEGMLAFFTQGRGLEGLDKSRPIGVVLQTDGMGFAPLGCLPVADINPMLELAEGFGIEPIGLADGVFEIELENQTVYLKSDGEWTFVGQTVESLASAPADPSATLASLVDEYDVAVQVLAQNVPEMYRDIAIEQMRQGMEDGLEQEEDESDEDFAFRKRLATAQLEQVQDLLTGLDELTIGWAIDSEAKQTYFDMLLKALPGSDMALACSTYHDATTNFAGFHRPDTALTMIATGTTPPELLEKQREQLEATVAMLRTQANKGIDEADEISDPADKEAIRGAVSDLLDAYESMLLSGEVDMGMSLNLAGEGFDLVGGAHAADPAKVESAFKKLAAAAENKPGFPGVEWNAESHAGVAFHRMTIPIPPEAGRIREAIGDEVNLTMGVGGEAVYLAIGTAGAAELKQAIDVSASRAGERVTPAEMSLSLRQVLEAAEPLVEGQAADVVLMVVEALREQPEGNDHIRITTKPLESGFRSRLVVEEGVLRAAGAAAAAAAAAQQGGGGGF